MLNITKRGFMNNDLIKYGLAFLAGAAVGALVSKNSKELRAMCTSLLSDFLEIKDKVVETAETIKESTEDLLAEAEAKRAKA